MNWKSRIKLRVLALSLPFLVGALAQASPIVFTGVFTSGTLTRTVGSPGNFSGTAYGPGLSFDVYLNTIYPAFFPDFTAPGTYTLNDSAGTGGLPGDTGGGYFFLNGTQYACSSTIPIDFSSCGSGFNLQTVFALPDYGSNLPAQVVLTEPFTGTGDFGNAPPGGQDFYLTATGVGIATITLQRDGPSSYAVRSAVYQFIAVPEPGTMLLAGIGLLAVILLRRRTANACPRT